MVPRAVIRRLFVVGSAVVLMTSASCGEGSVSADPTVSPGDQSSTSPAGVSTTVTAASDAEALLLANQVTVSLGGGNGEYLDCAQDPGESLPASFAAEPSVWLATVRRPGLPLELLGHVALCLHGFSPHEPVEVTVEAGAFRAGTTVKLLGESEVAPSTDAWSSAGANDLYLPPNTLFVDSAQLPVNSLGGEFWMSQEWMLGPDEAARVELAKTARALSVTAVQGTTAASHNQAVNARDGIRAVFADGLPETGKRLFIIGYEPGLRVPIGLYRVDISDDLLDGPGELVSQIGSVVVPPSGIAEFSVPGDPLADQPPGTYCLITPQEGEISCNFSNLKKP